MGKIYDDDNLWIIPNYTIKDASRYINIQVSTVRAWVYGRYYYTKVGKRRFEPLIKIPNPRIKQLSFTNLVEIHVLRSIRVVHDITLDKVRLALNYVEENFGYSNPLTTARFKTDGVDLFIEHLDSLIAASAPSQLRIIHKSFMNHLDRIEVDREGLARKIFPFASFEIDVDYDANLPKSVVIDPRVSFGRLVLANTGIPTSILAQQYKYGDSISDLAEDYRCNASQIEEAIRWELSVN